jgi:uncharacterized protein YkwD
MHRRSALAKFAYALLASVFVLVLVTAFVIGPALAATFSSLFSSFESGLSYMSNQQGNVSTNGPTLLYINAPKPSNYDILAAYMLQLINTDRAQNGVTSNVTLDYNPAAQQHAYSMLVNNYFSHWDTQGFKPYMRYTIAGGTGSVEENVAYVQFTGRFTSTSAVESALNQMEYDMVYNDAAHQNGHRFNILDPYHNMVSIGIAYDSNFVYLVQDFENKYITWSVQPALSANGQVVFSGGFNMSSQIQLIQVFYDTPPQPLTPNQLSNSPYAGSYDEGTFLGAVVPPGYTVQGGATITASIWNLGSDQFTIAFNMNSLVKSHGVGVYTLYVAFAPTGGKQETFTSLSFFVTNSST